MPCTSEHVSPTLPVADQNAPTPPIPADHAPITPQFVQQLLDELDDVRDERSRLWDEKYQPYPIGVKSKRPQSNVKRQMQIDYEITELDNKEAGIMAHIQQVRMLIPRRGDEASVGSDVSVKGQQPSAG